MLSESNKLIHPVALIQVLPYSLTIPFFLPAFPLSAFPFMKRHPPHQVTVFLDPLYQKSPFTEFCWKKNKWNDHDCPTLLLVLQYSRSVQGLILLYCHFRAFAFLFIAPAITFLLRPMNHGLHSSTALCYHCHQLYVCHHLHKFSVNYQFKLFLSIAPSKSLDTPQHSPHDKFIEFIITSQDKQSRLKASKFIFLHFSPNCKVFITKSQPKLHF